MSTVGQLMSRLYREYLAQGDDQPVAARLSGTITDSATSLTINTADLLPEDNALLGAGALIEVDTEIIRVTDYADETGVATVVRAQSGTTAAAHTAGALVYLSPVFSRQAVFDAVADNVYSLYPDLYHVATTALTTTSGGYTEVPAALMKPLDFRYASGGVYYTYGVEVLDNFTPSSTTKAVRIAVPTGTAGYLRYRARFTRPTTESDNLQTLGVELGWERIVVVGAAIQLLTGRELETVTTEYISEALQSQVYPEGSTTKKREGLYRFYQEWKSQAQRELNQRYSQLVEVNDPYAGWVA